MNYYPETETAVPVQTPARSNTPIVSRQRTSPTYRRRQHPHIPQPDPIIIDIPQPRRRSQSNTLSYYLEMGRRMHPLCRDSFIERVELGYYYYERRTEWRTCALAAAYAGLFGPRSVERPDFSESMAIWRLSQKLGYDLRTTIVYGPTGRCQPVIEEMIQLVDEDGWARDGVVEWLQTLNL